MCFIWDIYFSGLCTRLIVSVLHNLEVYVVIYVFCHLVCVGAFKKMFQDLYTQCMSRILFFKNFLFPNLYTNTSMLKPHNFLFVMESSFCYCIITSVIDPNVGFYFSVLWCNVSKFSMGYFYYWFWTYTIKYINVLWDHSCKYVGIQSVCAFVAEREYNLIWFPFVFPV